MKLVEFLLKHTKVGDIVVFREGGWQIGMTMIDNEDLFIKSLDSGLLLKEVRHHEYADRDWTNKKVLVVDIW